MAMSQLAQYHWYACLHAKPEMRQEGTVEPWQLNLGNGPLFCSTGLDPQDNYQVQDLT